MFRSSSASLLSCSHCHSAFVVVELLFSGKVAFYAPPTPLWQACEWPVCPLVQLPPHGLTCTWHCLLACICGCMWTRSSRNIVWRSQRFIQPHAGLCVRQKRDSFRGLVVECRPRHWQVVGSGPGQVLPQTKNRVHCLEAWTSQFTCWAVRQLEGL